MEIQFVKMEATGNDYVYFEREDILQYIERNSNIVSIVSDRRFGVGGDGVVVIARSDVAEAKMLMWNADGSSSAMCGNALRSVAFLVHRATGKHDFFIESGSGIHRARILSISGPNRAMVEVSMGAPRFAPREIPWAGDAGEGVLSDVEIQLSAQESVHATVLSMGNPHCVIYVDDVEHCDFERLGPILERHPLFPERTNVEFVARNAAGQLIQRTYERGSGETLSCGSGACATLVALHLSGRAKISETIRLRGGGLKIEWVGRGGADESILLSGCVRIVHQGSFSLENMQGIQPQDGC